MSMATILTISAKMAPLGFLKQNTFYNKVYDVIIVLHDSTNKGLSSESDCIVDVVMWLRFGVMWLSFGNSGISMREIITSILRKIWPAKTTFFWGVLLVEVQ